jgi:DNA-binding FrmR family transcriptional regulator
MSEEDPSGRTITFFDLVDDAANVVKRLGPKVESCKTMLDEMKQCLDIALNINTEASESARATLEGNQSKIKESASELKTRLYAAENQFWNAYNKFRNTSKQAAPTGDASLELVAKAEKKTGTGKRKETTVPNIKEKGAKQASKRKSEESPERFTGATVTRTLKKKQ